jgi:hypothetical protein
VKFLAELGKSGTGTYNLLMEMYDDEYLSRTHVFEWFERFKEGSGEIEDDLRPCQICASKTDANIEKVVA